MLPQTVVVDAPIALDQQPDQRQAQRHELSLPAIVTILGPVSEAVQCEIQNVSKGGTQLHLPHPIDIGSLLRIEYDNNLILGEVVYCLHEATGCIAGVRIEHTLSGLSALADAMGVAG